MGVDEKINLLHKDLAPVGARQADHRCVLPTKEKARSEKERAQWWGGGKEDRKDFLTGTDGETYVFHPEGPKKKRRGRRSQGNRRVKGLLGAGKKLGEDSQDRVSGEDHKLEMPPQPGGEKSPSSLL